MRATFDSEEFQTFMANRGFGVRFLASDEFGAFMANATEINASVIDALELKQ